MELRLIQQRIDRIGSGSSARQSEVARAHRITEIVVNATEPRTLRIVKLAQTGLFGWASLHSPSLEETGVGRVLLDVGSLTLFCDVDFAFYLRCVFAYYFGLITGALVAAIGRRHGRHFVVT